MQRCTRKTSVPIDLNAEMDFHVDNLKNVGYSVLKELYKQLELDKFWKYKLRNTSIKYDLEAVFRLLVFSRILYPASKLETFHSKDIYFEKIDGFSEKMFIEPLICLTCIMKNCRNGSLTILPKSVRAICR